MGASLLLCLAACGADIPVANGFTSAEITSHVAAVLQDYKRNSSAAPPELATVADRIVLDPRRLQLQDSGLQWTCFRQRSLSPEQRRATLDAWTRLLHKILLAPGRGAPLMTKDQARAFALASTLSIDRRPGLSQIQSDEVQEAVARFVANPGIHRQLVRQLQRVIKLDTDQLHCFDGLLSWYVPPVQEPRIRFSRRQDFDFIIQEYERRFGRYRGDLRSVLVHALTAHPHPRLAAPLLELDQFRNLKIDVQVQAPMRAAGMPGMEAVRPPSVRGTAKRTITSIRSMRPRRVPTLDDFDRFQAMVTAPDTPLLLLDQHGFQGAVVHALAFSPDGKQLAVAGDVVRIWEVSSGKLLHTLRGARATGGAGACTDLAFSPDGRQLLVTVSGLSDSLRVYDTNDYSTIQATFGEEHEGHIEHVAISHDGRWVATAGNFGRVNVWEWPKKTIHASYRFSHWVDHLSFPGRQPFLMAIDREGNYAFWQVAGAAARAPHGLLTPTFAKIRKDNGEVHPFAVFADYARGACVLGGLTPGDSKPQYWCRALVGSQSALHRHKYYVTACTLSSDGELAASADGLGNIHIWRANDGTPVRELRVNSHAIYSVAFGADWPERHEITFGHDNYQPPQWNFNSYGGRDWVFDFTSRSIRPQPSQPPVEPRLVSGQARLDYSRRALRVFSGDSVRSQIQFPRDEPWRPFSYTMLRGNTVGARNWVTVGMGDGSIELFEPESLMSRRSFLGHNDRVWSLDQSADSQYLLSGSGDGTIRLWKLEPPRSWGGVAVYNNQHGQVFHVIPGTPTSAAGIRDGDRIERIDFRTLGEIGQRFALDDQWEWKPGDEVTVEFTRGTRRYERKIELSRMGDVAKPLLSLLVTEDGRDWVIWTSQGYYDASPGGGQYVGWHVNRGPGEAADFYPLEHFAERFYRPDVIDKVLTTGDVAEAVRQADQQNRLAHARAEIPPPPASIMHVLPPRIEITSPPSNTITGLPEIEVSARIHSSSDVEKVSVLVNGTVRIARSVVLEAVGQPPQRTAGQSPMHVYEYRPAVPLSPGDNEIKLVVVNQNGLSHSASVNVRFRRTVAPTPKKRLLVGAVGVSKYQEQQYDLKFADADAIAFVKAWETQEGRLYDEVLSRHLTNEKATEEGVEKQLLDWLRENATQEDIVVLLVSGHGILHEETYFFAPHDMDLNRIRSTCVRWSAFGDLARDLKCPFLMFVDTCHAAGITDVTGLTSHPLLLLARDDTGVVVYSSCQRRELSREDKPWRHGAFTYALLNTFSDPRSDLDTEPDGRLSISELGRNLRERVRKLTGNKQTPVVYKPNGMDDLDLFILPPHAPAQPAF